MNLNKIFGVSALELVARLLILVSALPVHEYAHAAMASRLGDPTSANQGRLTLNPFVHLDPIGSLILLLFGFGWANPVQVNSRNFKNPRRDMALTALAGPLANVIMAFATMLVYKVLLAFTMENITVPILILLEMLNYIIKINIWLAIFNLLPLPPLDGFDIFGLLLPPKIYYKIIRNSYVFSTLLILLLYLGVLLIPVNIASNFLISLLDFLTRPVDWLAAFLR